MNWLNSIFPRKGMIYGGAALLLGLTPPPITSPVPAQEPARRLADRIAEISTTDILLSRKAKDAIQKDDKLGSCQIIVTVKNRIATIKGTVRSPEQAKRAMKVVREVPGMASVYNECMVAPVDSTPDEVAAAVKRAQGQPAGKPEDETGAPALTGRSANPDDIRPMMSDPRATVSSKTPMPLPPTTVLFHPDLSAPTTELLTALEKVRTSEPRFRELRYSVKSGVVRISGTVDRMSDANEFADRLTKVPGVVQVLLSKVEEK